MDVYSQNTCCKNTVDMADFRGINPSFTKN